MTFEVGDLKFPMPLDPTEGRIYVEPTRGGFSPKEIDNLYNVTTEKEDYVNPTIDGALSW